MRNQFSHILDFHLSNLKVMSAQKVFSTAQYHTKYYKCAEILSVD